ncbi:MAG: hypothetical protein IJ042_04805, partial [Butyricicoccus sp.]|nr:hypothetical protein [Butyricicoccus sp.]
EPGEMPEGIEPPMDGARPEMLEDVTMNDDGTITLPDGTVIDPGEMRGERPAGEMPEGVEPPAGGFGGGRGGMSGGMNAAETTTEFPLTAGANYFTVQAQ